MSSLSLRERSHEDVLSLVEPYRADIGLSRVADITGLDNIGIPVYCSYRPKGLLLQANSGKGLSHEQAQCSAWMEAFEYMHMEKPLDSTALTTEAYAHITKGNNSILKYEDLNTQQSPFFSHLTTIDWILLDGLHDDKHYLCPKDMVYLSSRSFTPCHTNGLSSGNSNSESILHGILELVERDAYSRIISNGRLIIRDVGKNIDLKTLDAPVLSGLVEMVESAGSSLYLILLPSSIPVYSFWSVIVDESSPMPVGSFNIGLGCHPNPLVAAVRAITEAAQSRLIYIHGNREDIRHKSVFSSDYHIPSSVFRFFRDLTKFSFQDVCSMDSPCDCSTVDSSLSNILEQLQRNGFARIYSHVLRDESLTFSVTKTFIPGFRCETRFL